MQEPTTTTLTFPDGKAVEHVYNIWPKQAQFHRTRKRYVCYGGARGPGKTVSLVEHVLAAMLKWPGIPILFLRKDLKDFKLTTLREIIARWPKELYDPKYGGQWNKGECWFRFPNGSQCWYGELKDWESYKSATMGMIAIDELNEVEEEAYINLGPTLRWTTGQGVCDFKECAALGAEFARAHPTHPFYQIVGATNPAPGWVKQRFWEPWKSGHERPNHAFISATAFDNPSLPPNFIPDLLENHSATWVQNYVYGDWSAFENMVWERWNRGVHQWRGPVPYGEFVSVEGGIDYGGVSQDAHRTCAYLTGRLPTGQYLTFWEYSKQGGAASDFFAQIRLATTQYRVVGWDADSSQHRANELLREAGVPVYDAPGYKGAVKDGINQVDRMLSVHIDKRPGIYVAETCPRLMAGIETYQLDPDTLLPKANQEDDEVNAWRYNVMRISKNRAVLGDRAIEVTGNSVSSRERKVSGILTRIKADRSARLKRFIAETEKKVV